MIWNDWLNSCSSSVELFLRIHIPDGKVWAVCLLLLLSAQVSRAQESQTGREAAHQQNHSPNGALFRAAAIPGWGQIYNRQYIKLPFVYGAMAGLILAVIRLNDDYQLYRNAFQYKAFQELVESGSLESNPRQSFMSSYEQLVDQFGPISSGPIRNRRDNLRRNRDLSIVGIGLVYGLSILDAFVSAHLMDFNVDDHLSLRMTPEIPGIRITASVGLSP